MKWAKSLSRVQLFVTPWTVAHQASPSMEFSTQEYWSGLPFPSPGDLPDTGIELMSPALAGFCFVLFCFKPLSYLGSPVTALLRHKYMPWKSPDNYDGVITHLEPDILESEVKWALGINITRNKASGGDGIPVELFQILKDDAAKVLHSICQQIWKTHRTGKGQFSFQSQRRAMPKNVQTIAYNCAHSHASKVILKILQARLQQYMRRELPDG